MNQGSVVTVRFATQDDVDKILHVSEGIYDGRDYLPVVLKQWLNHERKLIYLAEYEGEVIGLQVATIAEDQQSFVTQALRIHPKYRGKKLSYQLTEAVITSIRKSLPQVLKNRSVCSKNSPAFLMFRNKGFKPIMEQRVHALQRLPSDVLTQKCPELCDSELVPLGTKDALELYKSEKLLNIIGSHSVVLVDNVFPHKLPEDAHIVAKKVENTVFVDVSLQEFRNGKFPKSFSQGVLSKRVATDIWICQIYTDDTELYKKHFLRQLNAAAQRIQRKEFIFRFFQSSCSQFDGCKLVKDEISRLKLNCEVESEVRVLLEYDLK
ncbi:uncharacterized protein LOC110245602 [Exaiptasia diaphana]|uniref:N-acetyltransferase domain-containing protein n=1 Tax=Exaiptasia diaphana TaxID=2652724 RepID=A0A913XPD6_EXADI|nr:uncharacterized protein LOC110245602 [Exaiptasia diaphana]